LFRFASHWKYENRSYRTLTKAYGLRFIISVSGHAGQFDVITLTLNIGSLIGILGLATFICDIVALYVHRQSDVYRRQKFQDVDLNLLRLETLNNLPLGMMSEESKLKHANHVEQAILTGHVIDNKEAFSHIESPQRDKFQREKINHHDLYDNISATSKDTNQQSTPMLIYGNYHQQKSGMNNSLDESPGSIKQRRSASSRPKYLPVFSDEKTNFYDKTNIVFVDEDSPDVNNEDQRYSKPITPKIETFL
jgi:hypothetical protein